MGQWDLGLSLLLAGAGFVAGIINVLAGGGSNLVLPVLMVMGMPADVANATNRVGITLQSFVATYKFKQHNKLQLDDIGAILWPTLVGGLLGGAVAAFAPESLLKPMLLGAMLGVALMMLVNPKWMMPQEGESVRVQDRPFAARLSLFIAGFYGGFVQAGVGFLLLAALAGTLRYDLVRANALKIVCTLGFTLVSVALFIWQDLIQWIPGLVLAVGNMLGAWVAVKLAIKANPKSLKWFIFLMTLVGCVAALASN